VLGFVLEARHAEMEYIKSQLLSLKEGARRVGSYKTTQVSLECSGTVGTGMHTSTMHRKETLDLDLQG
jgi:hypothetical protein